MDTIRKIIGKLPCYIHSLSLSLCHVHVDNDEEQTIPPLAITSGSPIFLFSNSRVYTHAIIITIEFIASTDDFIKKKKKEDCLGICLVEEAWLSQNNKLDMEYILILYLYAKYLLEE